MRFSRASRPATTLLRRRREYNFGPEIRGERAVRQRQGRVDEHLEAPNAQRAYKVTRADLPLHCPLPSMYLWNSHPKVYLPIEATGEATCPYCSTTYRLVDDTGGAPPSR